MRMEAAEGISRLGREPLGGAMFTGKGDLTVAFIIMSSESRHRAPESRGQRYLRPKSNLEVPIRRPTPDDANRHRAKWRSCKSSLGARPWVVPTQGSRNDYRMR